MKKGLTVIKRDVMPDGTHIQLESWGRNDGTGDIEIGAYPVCKETLNVFFTKGKTFRLTLVRLPQDEVQDIYHALIQGKLTLADCVQYFHQPKDYVPALNLETAA